MWMKDIWVKHEKYLRDVIKYYLIFLAVGATGILFSLVTKVGTICMFNKISNIPCPACGMTSAFIDLFHFNIKEAFINHPLFWVILILPFIFATNKNKIIISSGIIFILVWITRLIITYPNFY